MSHKGVNGRGQYGNKVGNSLRNKRERERERERQTNGGGRRLQAQGTYKGWPRPSQRLALAAPESSRDVAE